MGGAKEKLICLVVVHQGKADEQLNWKILQNEKIAGLKEKLRRSREQLLHG